MHLLGGANWWLPGWLERTLPRISIEAPDRPDPDQRPLPVPRPRAPEEDAARTPVP